METKTDPVPSPGGGGGVFQTTQWTLVLAAKNGSAPDAQAALEELCRIYSPALYAYLRRTGHSVEDAQDLAQEFLSRFVQREWLNHLEDQRGKFRSFLLTFLKHFLSDEYRRANAQKRGGGKSLISLDACEADEREAMTQSPGLTPDQIFDRRWAETVMGRALEQLRAEYARRGKLELFEHLKDFVTGDCRGPKQAAIASATGMTLQAVKSAAHSIRKRYRELMWREVAETVVDPRDVAAELEHLIRLFAR